MTVNEFIAAASFGAMVEWFAERLWKNWRRQRRKR